MCDPHLAPSPFFFFFVKTIETKKSQSWMNPTAATKIFHKLQEGGGRPRARVLYKYNMMVLREVVKTTGPKVLDA